MIKNKYLRKYVLGFIYHCRKLGYDLDEIENALTNYEETVDDYK